MDPRDNDGRNIEPRTLLWAVAEVWWEDPAGKPLRLPATLEDTSLSGACVRLKTPITIGSRLTVKWHREQFAAVARNCRSDGREFLLGLRRDPFPLRAEASPQRPTPAEDKFASGLPQNFAAATKPQNSPPQPEVPNPSSAAWFQAGVRAHQNYSPGSRGDDCNATDTRPILRPAAPRNPTQRSRSTRSISTQRLVSSSRKESHAAQKLLSQVLATPAGNHRRA